jgi:hypothetical protein
MTLIDREAARKSQLFPVIIGVGLILAAGTLLNIIPQLPNMPPLAAAARVLGIFIFSPLWGAVVVGMFVLPWRGAKWLYRKAKGAA